MLKGLKKNSQNHYKNIFWTKKTYKTRNSQLPNKPKTTDGLS